MVRNMPIAQQRARPLNVTEPEPDVECPICLQRLRQERQPRALPCLHTFCNDCLVNLVYTNAGSSPRHSGSWPSHSNKIQCPVCRKRHRLPAEGVSGFPIDFRVVQVVDYFDKRAEMAPPVENADTTCCSLSTEDKENTQSPTYKHGSLPDNRDIVAPSAPTESDVLDDALNRALANNNQTKLTPSAPKLIPSRRKEENMFAASAPEVKVQRPNSPKPDPRRTGRRSDTTQRSGRRQVVRTLSSDSATESLPSFSRNSRREKPDFLVTVLSAFFSSSR